MLVMNISPVDQSTTHKPQDRPWRTIFNLCCPLTVGILIAFLVHEYWYIPKVGLGSVERIVRFGQLLDHQFPADKANVVALGNSIVYEGLDAQLANQESGEEFRIWNCAIGGFALTEQKIMLPKIVSANPKAIVINLEPESIRQLNDLSDYKCYAFAYAGFTKYWPKEWNADNWTFLNAENVTALSSNRWQQVAYFRNAPLNNFNQTARRSVRAELKQSPPDDWNSPHEMIGDLHGERLQEHLKLVRSNILKKFGSDSTAGKEIILAIVEYLQSRKVVAIVVCLPVHPELQDAYNQQNWQEYAAFCDELKSKYDAHILDMSRLLTTDDFADAVHPNESGRKKYSITLGKAISQLPLKPILNSPLVFGSKDRN
jgi:hypothetical protein